MRAFPVQRRCALQDGAVAVIGRPYEAAAEKRYSTVSNELTGKP